MTMMLTRRTTIATTENRVNEGIGVYGIWVERTGAKTMKMMKIAITKTFTIIATTMV